MVQSETGLSKVHFEASLELGTSTEAPEAISAEEIKGPKQLAPENLRCQNPGCSLQPLEEGQLKSASKVYIIPCRLCVILNYLNPKINL